YEQGRYLHTVRVLEQGRDGASEIRGGEDHYVRGFIVAQMFRQARDLDGHRLLPEKRMNHIGLDAPALDDRHAQWHAERDARAKATVIADHQTQVPPQGPHPDTYNQEQDGLEPNPKWHSACASRHTRRWSVSPRTL